MYTKYNWITYENGRFYRELCTGSSTSMGYMDNDCYTCDIRYVYRLESINTDILNCGVASDGLFQLQVKPFL